jgi:hypothetical protein
MQHDKKNKEYLVKKIHLKHVQMTTTPPITFVNNF